MSDKKKDTNRQTNNKQLILTIGVILTALLIIILWFLNFRQIIFQPSLGNKIDRQNWEQLQTELDENLKEFSAIWGEIKTSEELSQGQELINQIKEQIESDLDNQLATNTSDQINQQFDDEITVVNDNQSVDEEIELSIIDPNKTTNCPEFIDCFSDNKATTTNCVIPDGCEDISFIVY